jgi:peptide/nickel transport system substrate-binding protein
MSTEISTAMVSSLNRRLLLQGSLAVATLPMLGTGHAQQAQPASASPQRGGTLVISLAPEPQIITAAFLTTMQVTMIAGKISEGLVWFDDKLQPQPEPAFSLLNVWQTTRAAGWPTRRCRRSTRPMRTPPSCGCRARHLIC